jgi:hypothetical protein
MTITRRIHLNPQSKGSLGKSFETEFRTAWLDWHGIPWTGSDLDDRHHTFADRHPNHVKSYRLGHDDDSKATLLGLFRGVARGDEPVHVIDVRAQADGLILHALEELHLLESMAAAGLRFTFLLFPSEDTESMSNLMDLFFFAGDRVDYVIVRNPAKVRTDLFKGSSLEAELAKFGARSITLPTITPITLLAMKRAEARAARSLGFAELAHPESKHLELILAGELQWAMQKLFPQYQEAAELLVPADWVPKDVFPPQPEPAPRRQSQRMLNLGE